MPYCNDKYSNNKAFYFSYGYIDYTLVITNNYNIWYMHSLMSFDNA